MKEKNPHAVALGRAGGSVTGAMGGRKAWTSAENGEKGGALPGVVRQVLAEGELPRRSEGRFNVEASYEVKQRQAARTRTWRWWVEAKQAAPDKPLVELVVKRVVGERGVDLSVEFKFEGKRVPVKLEGGRLDAATVAAIRERFDLAKTLAGLT
ncbi:MAG: hypothetical protein WA993_17580 [Candidatus Binatus sp.]|jgi:hypothetical protein|uniref:hypothetical protein n=1 Tax=Candidatus Binatus sp. TaxID=2811406 RepID=UPI003C891664